MFTGSSPPFRTQGHGVIQSLREGADRDEIVTPCPQETNGDESDQARRRTSPRLLATPWLRNRRGPVGELGAVAVGLR
jgi:hypothetical protein